MKAGRRGGDHLNASTELLRLSRKSELMMDKLSLNGCILQLTPMNLGVEVFLPSLGVKTFSGDESKEGVSVPHHVLLSLPLTCLAFVQ